MSVEQNQINPDISHDALKEALIRWDIDSALEWQSQITWEVPKWVEVNINEAYEFVCKMDNISESFPNYPEFTEEMCSILDKHLTV